MTRRLRRLGANVTACDASPKPPVPLVAGVATKQRRHISASYFFFVVFSLSVLVCVIDRKVYESFVDPVASAQISRQHARIVRPRMSSSQYFAADVRILQ